MEPILEFGLETTRWLQQTFPQLEAFFKFISELGTEEFYLIFVPFIYWCVDKRMGRYLGYLFLFDSALNYLGKHAFRGPRPYWLESSLGLSEESSYGVPSSHTQLATAVYLFLATWLQKPWMWLVAIVMVLLMGISRIYLGVHFVHDVVVGTAVSALLIITFWVWYRRASKSFEKRILGYRMMVALIVPLVLTAVYILVRFLIGQPDTSVAWAAYIPTAEQEGIEGIATSVGVLLGLGPALVLEASRVRFRAEGPPWQRVLRLVVGMIGALLIWAGLRAIFPEDPLWLAIVLRVLRYFLLGMWVGLYAPMLFVRLGLAQADPQPTIDLKLS